MQIDLQTPEIYKVIQDGVELNIIEKGMSFIELVALQNRVCKGTYRFLWR
jgi:hypothetical protein